ncbi:L-amino acid N-acyltransferase YncA [Sanguibacter gelidistatuariae]|uniref:L-amino acid N-acyltransferase YncA n=1 Tax=Sanguibacter gelidistatuariae TaxID=1814289 RepID=A0A1G6NRB3_9MICO|nr:GNAT family N-acetyltransferase [Sanguibacter gelidistatuariae]SDC69856.1 L-amino acid N-acyltransferase YncA [Sanguibacter gelidistatuariae]
MALFTESADVSVRPAQPEDVEAVTDVQLAAWRLSHDGVLGEQVMDSLDVPRMREQWAAAITAPPGPGFAVFVACNRADVVGFAAVGPGQLVALEVLPSEQRSGHGSRLLSAAVDRIRSDGAQEFSTWVLDEDPAREQFLAGAGLGPDGRRRSLATGVRDVTESRWSATL